jgi:hypothetical protein
MNGRERLQRLLSDPLAGFAPWIAMSVTEGPGRFELSVGLAFSCALLIALVGAVVGIRPMLLDLAGVAFFAALIVAGLLVDDAGLDWLERWSGELSNVTIALIALCTVLVGRPFTLAYAREQTAREHWRTPLFERVSYVITSVWLSAFLLTAIVGFIGDGPLGEDDNLWTNWILQIAALIVAARFTEWYPERAVARDRAARGEPGRPEPPLRDLLLPLVGYLVPVGIIVIAVAAAPWWVGGALIVLGAVITRRFVEEDATDRASASDG